jgi:hypothetical protein
VRIASVTAPRSTAPRRAPGWGAAAALLALHAVLSVTATLGKTVTFDEPGFLAAGVAQWTLHRFDLGPEAGSLPERLGAIPFVLDGVQLPARFAAAPADPVVTWKAGTEVVFGEAGRAERLLARSRALMALVSVLAGALVYLLSRQIFGREGGIVSVALFAFCPNFLAHGPLVTADVTAAAALLGASAAAWRLLHRVTAATILTAGAAVGALLLAKGSGLLILPVVALLLAVRLGAGRPLVAAPSARVVEGRARQLAWCLGGLAAAGAVALGCVWAAYDVRFTAWPRGAAAGLTLRWDPVLASLGPAGAALRAVRDLRLLPESWLFGIGYALSNVAESHYGTFFLGAHRPDGSPWYFPVTWLLKTPLGTLAVVAAAVGAVAAGAVAARGRSWRAWRIPYRAAPVLALGAVYGAAVMRTPLQIGVRHLLPLCAVVFVLAGAAGRWLRDHRPAVRVGLVALLASAAIEAVAVHPHYLAFFNVAAGGPDRGWELLGDSSLDWGQDLPAFARWLRERPPELRAEPAYLSYFGNGSIEYYGTRATILPGFGVPDQLRVALPPLLPGLYCMSATLLQGSYWSYAEGNRWSPELQQALHDGLSAVRARLSRGEDEAGVRELALQLSRMRVERLALVLLARRPIARIGHTLFVYRLGPGDLAEVDPMWAAAGAPR